MSSAMWTIPLTFHTDDLTDTQQDGLYNLVFASEFCQEADYVEYELRVVLVTPEVPTLVHATAWALTAMRNELLSSGLYTVHEWPEGDDIAKAFIAQANEFGPILRIPKELNNNTIGWFTPPPPQEWNTNEIPG